MAKQKIEHGKTKFSGEIGVINFPEPFETIPTITVGIFRENNSPSVSYQIIQRSEKGFSVRLNNLSGFGQGIGDTELHWIAVSDE